jgi:hypothetical protein
MGDTRDTKNDWSFLEVWADPTAFPPYVLTLVGMKSGSFVVFDPAAKNAKVFEGRTYEQARNFLLEDEYTLVQGRVSEADT